MCDEAMVDAYLGEADRHIRDAEGILLDLGSAGSARMRRLRAATYLKAMRRLRGLIAAHRSLPWNQSTPAAAVVRDDPRRALHWPMRWRRRPLADASDHECLAR